MCPHARTPAPDTHGQRAPTARPGGGPSGGGQAPNPRRPSKRHEVVPGMPSHRPLSAQELWGRCRAPTPTPPTPGTHGLAAHSRDRRPGRGSVQHRTPLATVRGLAACSTSGRPREGERLTPDAPRSRRGTRPPRAHRSSPGRCAHVRDTQRSPGSNAPHQPAE